MSKQVESHKLSADIENLFELITKFLYSSKEIFLRELISNASDALDKYRLMSVRDPSLVEAIKGSNELRIDVIPSLEAKTLTIRDTGCGMTHDELISNLSSIAHSGTKEFLRAAKEKISDEALIGQFGVGFFSAFLVSKEVIVKTFSMSDLKNKKGYLWKSSGCGAYTIEEIENESGVVGTEIVLSIKESEEEYLQDENLKKVIKKYNAFAAYPLYVHVKKEFEVEEDEKQSEEVKKSEEKKDENEEGDAKVEEVKEDEEEAKEEKKEKKKEMRVVEEKINVLDPIWRRKKEEVTEEEYKAFYKEISGDYSSHLAVKHFKVEGEGIEFSAVLFIPERAPFNFMGESKQKKNIKLHVKRVFIMDDCQDLVPEWLTFISGVIDSEHLDLNVSREILQKSAVIKKIRRIVTKKVVELLKEVSEDPEKFKTLMEQFGKYIKLGIHEDSDNRESLGSLLRFNSSKRKEKISFEDYLEEFDKKFKGKIEDKDRAIYYIAAENLQSAKDSPFLEGYRKNNVEVIFMTETIDEYCATALKDFKGAKLLNITKAGVSCPAVKKDTEKDDEKKEEKKEEEQTDAEKKFLEEAKKELGTQVESVQSVTYLHSSPASISSPEHAWSANMERIIKSQAMKDNMMASFMGGKKILGLNLKHPIVKKMIEDMDANTDRFKKTLRIVFYNACMNCGYSLENNTKEFTNAVMEMVCGNLGVESVGEEEKKEVEAEVEQKDSEKATEDVPVTEID